MKNSKEPRFAVEIQNGVAVVRLQRGVPNAIDPEFVEQLRQQLASLAGDPAVRGLTLTSANEKFFSIGFDLPRLAPLPSAEFARFFEAFNTLCLDLFTFPKPTVAAVTGHAIAGGCILTLCCDYRYVSDARKLMGLNEVKLGVPVPYVAHRILSSLVGDRAARDITYSGDFYPPAAAQNLGLADRILPPEEVLPEALQTAASLGSAPGDAFAQNKRLRVAALAAEMAGRRAQEEARFVERWYSPEARECLQEALAKF